jgi:hypothetical protein
MPYITRNKVCPACGEGSVHHSHYRLAEYALTLGLLRPYRCHKCRTRFWRPRRWLPKAKVVGKVVLWVVAFALMVGLIWWGIDFIGKPPPLTQE